MASSEHMTDTLRLLSKRINRLRVSHASDDWILVAFAGVPGSGKSSIAAALLRHLREADICDVCSCAYGRCLSSAYCIVSADLAFSQDGFHYPKSALATFPDAAEAISRRGAPFTFDAESCIAAVK